jgi:hypothetical protein
MKKASEYFHLRTYCEDAAAFTSPTGQYIFGLEPHDVLPLSICNFHTALLDLPLKPLGCITSLCFKVPLMKHVYTWMTAHSVDKKDIIRALNNGYSPVICPGGVQEVIYLGNEAECVLYLKRRAGFIKLALRYGHPIVPVFAFGLRKQFTFYVPKSHFLHKLGRKFGALPMVFFGVFGLPLGPAKPCDLTNVIGKPIVVPKLENPSDEEIKKYHVLYMDEIARLFNTYKHDFDMGEVTLRII